MARLRAEVAAFREGKDNAFFVRVLREWQGDAHGRALVRLSIVGMARKRDERVCIEVTMRGVTANNWYHVSQQVRKEAISAWRETAAGIAQNRRRKEQTEEKRAAERSRVATLIQAVWRSHSTRKVLWTQSGRGRYLSFFVSEAGRAASTGRYERLFWLADRWPALTQHEVFAATLEGGGGGEGLLHLACRATAHRCVELCLQREADVHGVTPAGLTPLHYLALYRAPSRGDRANYGYGGSLTAMDDHDRNAENYYGGGPHRRSQTSTAVVAVPPTTSPGPSSPNSAISAPTGQRGSGVTLPNDRSVVARQQQQRQLERQYQQQQRKLSADRSARTIADMLLDAGADPDAVDGDGNTPLLTAAKTGAAVLCEILLARGANPCARNNSGSNALLLAVDGDNSAENSACVQVLLDAGSDPHETGPDGTVALHVSARKGQTELDLTDAAGRTALHVASQDGKVNALGELLGRSVNVDAKDAMGETALHYAAYSGKVLQYNERNAQHWYLW
ncbi:unnamed protein product [Ectocarpus sp. CCAP 1310/34]|nr:unnamed protein product [Ectocarpus sp. CCAP 1310/34]